MSICKKYGISEEAYKMMFADGWIVCKASTHQEIYNLYKKALDSGLNKQDAIHEASTKCRVSDRTVYTAIKEFE